MCSNKWNVIAFGLEISFCTMCISTIQVSIFGDGTHEVIVVSKSTQFDGS